VAAPIRCAGASFGLGDRPFMLAARAKPGQYRNVVRHAGLQRDLALGVAFAAAIGNAKPERE